MGRRRRIRKDLPRRVYFDHGSYYFVPKKGPKVNLGRDMGHALQKYAELVQRVCEHRQLLGDVMDLYAKEKIPTKKPRTQSDYRDAIARLRPVFGAMWPEDLEPKHVYEYLRTRKAKIRANREIAVLSNVMQQAIEMGLVMANPCRQVRRNTESPRTREVANEELASFLNHCPPWMQAYIQLKVLTGLRQGDMLQLTRFSARSDGLFVETAKRGKRLLFAWSDALKQSVEACHDLRRLPSEAKLFPITTDGFRSAWARAMSSYLNEAPEHHRFAENDLRAKVASDALDLGLDAASMLGHSSDAVTRRHYARGTRKVRPLR